MTFQIGVVASDGVLIAGDQRTGRWEKFATTSHVPKIYCDETLGAIYCGSGSETAIRVGRKMIEISSGELGQPMWKCAEKAAMEVWNRENRSPQCQSRRFAETVLVAQATDSGFGLWRVEVSESPLCQPILDRNKSGDESNAAIFFSERYFPSMSEERPPIAHLLPLAAHIVLMAGRLNPTGVDGLEIAICRAGECRMLQEHELAPLRDFSNRLDDLVRSQFVNATKVIG